MYPIQPCHQFCPVILLSWMFLLRHKGCIQVWSQWGSHAPSLHRKQFLSSPPHLPLKTFVSASGLSVQSLGKRPNNPFAFQCTVPKSVLSAMPVWLFWLDKDGDRCLKRQHELSVLNINTIKYWTYNCVWLNQYGVHLSCALFLIECLQIASKWPNNFHWCVMWCTIICLCAYYCGDCSKLSEK